MCLTNTSIKRAADLCLLPCKKKKTWPQIYAYGYLFDPKLLRYYFFLENTCLSQNL